MLHQKCLLCKGQGLIEVIIQSGSNAYPRWLCYECGEQHEPRYVDRKSIVNATTRIIAIYLANKSSSDYWSVGRNNMKLLGSVDEVGVWR